MITEELVRELFHAEKALQSFIPEDSQEVMAQLVSISEIHCYQKSERLYEIGDVQSKVYLLVDGILRGYVLDDMQTDITDCFMTDRWMAANSADFFIEGSRKPSFCGYGSIDGIKCAGNSSRPAV